MGSSLTCKLNPCCGNRLSCTAFEPSPPKSEEEQLRGAIKLGLQMKRETEAKKAAAALSPAPEAGSDEVERLRARAKKSCNDLQLVWDGILGDRPRCRDCADEDGICPHSKLPCDPTEAAVAQALIWKNEAAALRDQLGKMREALAEPEIERRAKQAANAIGVTPHSDMRLFVEQAVKYALATLAETQEAGR